MFLDWCILPWSLLSTISFLFIQFSSWCLRLPFFLSLSYLLSPPLVHVILLGGLVSSFQSVLCLPAHSPSFPAQFPSSATFPAFSVHFPRFPTHCSSFPTHFPSFPVHLPSFPTHCLSFLTHLPSSTPCFTHSLSFSIFLLSQSPSLIPTHCPSLLPCLSLSPSTFLIGLPPSSTHCLAPSSCFPFLSRSTTHSRPLIDLGFGDVGWLGTSGASIVWDVASVVDVLWVVSADAPVVVTGVLLCIVTMVDLVVVVVGILTAGVCECAWAWA